jgi:hypothetical protein
MPSFAFLCVHDEKERRRRKKKIEGLQGNAHRCLSFSLECDPLPSFLDANSNIPPYAKKDWKKKKGSDT